MRIARDVRNGDEAEGSQSRRQAGEREFIERITRRRGHDWQQAGIGHESRCNAIARGIELLRRPQQLRRPQRPQRRR